MERRGLWPRRHSRSRGFRPTRADACVADRQVWKATDQLTAPSAAVSDGRQAIRYCKIGDGAMSQTMTGVQPATASRPEPRAAVKGDFDVVIVGAGFGGMYMLHRLRQLGMSAVIFDVATGVGGTWYWNR